MELIKKLLVGGVSNSSAFQLDWNVLLGSLRALLVVALVTGLSASLGVIDAHDWGFADSLISGAIAASIEFLRRWSKNYATN